MPFGNNNNLLRTNRTSIVMAALLAVLLAACSNPNTQPQVQAMYFLLEPGEATLNAGETVRLVPNVPSAAAGVWRSLDDTVATVDSAGTVTAVTQGSTVIELAYDDGTAMTATATVHVLSSDAVPGRPEQGPGSPRSSPPTGAATWTVQLGTTGYDYSRAVAVGPNGDVIVAGDTQGNLGGPAAGGSDAFVTRLAPSGEELFTTQFGSPADERVFGVAVDAEGNAVVVGDTTGDVGETNQGGSDVFVTKVGPNGDIAWSTQFGTQHDDVAFGVAIDASGAIIVAGYTSGDLGGLTAGGTDVFVAKLGSDGSVLWRTQFGTARDDGALSVAVDASGSVLVAGYTWGDLEGTSHGGRDAFVAKLTNDGIVTWTRQFGTSSSDGALGVAVDASGNVLVAGTTDGDLAGRNSGERDAYLAKFDRDGREVWTEQFGTRGDDYAWGVTTDADGNAYVAGYTWEALDGPHVGLYDAYVRQFGPGGELTWSEQFGTTAYDYARSVTVGPQGTLYVAGFTEGILGDSSAGGKDAFVSKLGF